MPWSKSEKKKKPKKKTKQTNFVLRRQILFYLWGNQLRITPNKQDWLSKEKQGTHALSLDIFQQRLDLEIVNLI
jgi:hypothetical protein